MRSKIIKLIKKPFRNYIITNKQYKIILYEMKERGNRKLDERDDHKLNCISKALKKLENLKY